MQDLIDRFPLPAPTASRSDRPRGIVHLADEARVPLCHDSGEPLYERDEAGELRECRLACVKGRIALKQGWLSVTELPAWVSGVTEMLLPMGHVVKVEILG